MEQSPVDLNQKIIDVKPIFKSSVRISTAADLLPCVEAPCLAACQALFEKKY